jgi:hypothetical protein
MVPRMNEHDTTPVPTNEITVEEIDIEEYVRSRRPIPHANRYVIRIDKEKRVVHTPILTGRQILALVGKTPDKFKLYEHFPGKQPEPIQPDQEVHLQKHHVERFTTMAKDTTEGRSVATLRREFRLPAGDEQYLDSLELQWETIRDAGVLWLLVHDWKLPAGYNAPLVRLQSERVSPRRLAGTRSGTIPTSGLSRVRWRTVFSEAKSFDALSNASSRFPQIYL